MKMTMTCSIYLLDTLLAMALATELAVEYPRFQSLKLSFLHAPLLQFTQVSNLSDFLACLLVPISEKVTISRR